MIDRPAVMFDRSLKPEWVDFALEQYVHSSSEETLRNKLKEWLEGQGFGEYTVAKTALQLQRTVGYRSPFSRQELEQMYSDMQTLSLSERDAVRLAALFRANEFIKSLFDTLNRAKLNGADGLTVQQLYERLQADYGHRGMIPRRVRYALQTLVSFGVVEHRGRQWLPKSSAI